MLHCTGRHERNSQCSRRSSSHDRSQCIRPKGNWKSKVFCGVVGLDGRCSVQAGQRTKPAAVSPLPGAYLSTETNFVPTRDVTKKEFDTGHTHTQLKRRGPPGPRRMCTRDHWQESPCLSPPPPPPPFSNTPPSFSPSLPYFPVLSQSYVWCAKNPNNIFFSYHSSKTWKTYSYRNHLGETSNLFLCPRI